MLGGESSLKLSSLAMFAKRSTGRRCCVRTRMLTLSLPINTTSEGFVLGVDLHCRTTSTLMLLITVTVTVAEESVEAG